MSNHFGREGTWSDDREESPQTPKRSLSELRNLNLRHLVSESQDSLGIPGASEKGIKHEASQDSDDAAQREHTSPSDSDRWSITSSREIGPTENAIIFSRWLRKLRKSTNSSYGADYEQVFPEKDATKRSKIQSDANRAEERFEQAYQYLSTNINELSDRGLGGRHTKDAFVAKYQRLYEKSKVSKEELDAWRKAEKRKRYEKGKETFDSTNELIAMEDTLKEYIKWKSYRKLFMEHLIGKNDVMLSGDDEVAIARHRLSYASFEVGKIYKEKGYCEELKAALRKEYLFEEQYTQLAAKNRSDHGDEVEKMRHEWRELGWHDPQSHSQEDKIKIRTCEYRQIALEEGVASVQFGDTPDNSLSLADLDYLHVESSHIKKRIAGILRILKSDTSNKNLKLISDWTSVEFSADVKATLNTLPRGSKPDILTRIYQERVKENIDRLYKYTKNLHPEFGDHLRQLSDLMSKSIKQRTEYAADKCFQREFFSSIEKNYGYSETQLEDFAEDNTFMFDFSSINRHFKVSDVPRILGKPLAIARGKAKYMIIEQERALYRYRGSDRDTTEDFDRNFKIIRSKEQEAKEPGDRRFEIDTESREGVRSRSRKNEVSSFSNIITIKANHTMEFEGRSNYNYTDFSQSEMGWFHHCRLALEKADRSFSDVTFTRYSGPIVRNPEAVTTMEILLEGVKKDENGDKEKTFKEGDDEFYAYLGLEVGQGKGFMPAQHQIDFKGIRLTSVKVKLRPNTISTECTFSS